MDVEKLRTKLTGFGQSHLLDHWDDLSPSEQGSLYEDLQSIPYDEMASIFERTMRKPSTEGAAAEVKMEPISDDLCASVVDTDADTLEAYSNTALESVAKGHVGVLLLAGETKEFFRQRTVPEIFQNKKFLKNLLECSSLSKKFA